ncbi:bifunctional ADP-dependent NAD(P)H-hydrate dehydratase/NAD(P)H-hydrate epimerase [Herbaspirillum chlorophenolicum]|uniref:bifunctional ADP-dependent NAD(P)H-hydrate dehydratase/NAD(P)H-hydrate epimerase n=1 Tax=Herbaspirillum chlorophenolicum TaxID=211589 RepID=UPI00067D94E7|nr:bifunctional ADP-dependent NAD(P)H-hydrate dehydratase/NAD(P)H-hydrate epimerase [Herbaspirillum chlorophenolicum]
MSALYSVAEIREVEQTALSGLPSYTLMQRAGAAVAEYAQQLLSSTTQSSPSVLVLAGPGNNGGDALEAACILEEAGIEVAVQLHADQSKQPHDARRALARAREAEIQFIEDLTPAGLREQSWALVIDGLFGIGLTRAPTSKLRAIIDHVNGLPCPVLSIDVPSGLNADTGSIVGGADGLAVNATHTITFIGDKPGLHTCEGKDHSGLITLQPLDIDPGCYRPTRAVLNGPAHFAASLKPRANNSHKGSYGDVIVVGGARGMAGAPVLAARTAAFGGAGRVYLAFVDDGPAYDSMHPELMFRVADRVEFGASAALVVGPGMGTSRHAHDILARALDSQADIVVDADALNLISAEPTLQHKLHDRRGGSGEIVSIITPHPLEAARLLDTTTQNIQNDRPQAARMLARHFNAITILKGAGTVIAFPDGEMLINPTGNPALSTAGTGDVLSGLCGALLAQGWPLRAAALAATWIHGAAADRLVAQGLGPVGLTASEFIPAIRAVFNNIIRDHVHQRPAAVPSRTHT